MAIGEPTTPPIYPATASGQAPADIICPAYAPIFIQTNSGYTCATKSQVGMLQMYLARFKEIRGN